MRSVAVFFILNVFCDLVIFFVKPKKGKEFNLKVLILKNLGLGIPLVMAFELDLVIENNSFFNIAQLLIIGFIGKELIEKLDILGIPISKKMREIIDKINNS